MCGIIGIAGEQLDTLNVLMTGLENLEYRGYDSAGIAVANGNLRVVKRKGELSHLQQHVNTIQSDAIQSPVGIGHTRWSTHGEPSDVNAHPHTDCTENIAVVHNGIIENYQTLREELETLGHTFSSETDTEVIPHLIEQARTECEDSESAFQRATERLSGSYAIAAVFTESDVVYAIRQDSPLVIGLGEHGHFLASDVPAFRKYTDTVIYLENDEFVQLDESGVTVTDENGTELRKEADTVSWDADDVAKSGYDHYMLKEIHEQPRALRRCLQGRIDELGRTVSVEELDDISDFDRVQLVACGTSYHAALYGTYLLNDAGVPSQAFLASEYVVQTPTLSSDTLVVGVTQSGETADTLSALRRARNEGARTLAITNTVGSTAARECDHTLYIRSGPEIGVAATKTFASQLVSKIILMIHEMAESRRDPDLRTKDILTALNEVPDNVQQILDTTDAESVAREYDDEDAYFFIGRGYQYPVALEGALKFKEITYEHAEGFAAGELKHGPLALVTERTPVFAIAVGDGQAAGKTLNNVEEVCARGAPVIAITDDRTEVSKFAEHTLRVPETHPVVAPILANVQSQLVSYHVAKRLGRPIDKPRNLAKSVTVE